MTIPEAAEKVFDFTESIIESGNHTFELGLDARHSIYFEANFYVDWEEIPASHISPGEYDRIYCGLSNCILVVQDDEGDVVEDMTAELQREFCEWFGEILFDEN